jgi:hypothetical protein
MVGWKWHPPRLSGPVQRRVREVMRVMREGSTNEITLACYPTLRPDKPAFVLRRRRVRTALHDLGARPVARIRQLSALVLNFIEQSHVLDRDHRLVGEGAAAGPRRAPDSARCP